MAKRNKGKAKKVAKAKEPKLAIITDPEERAIRDAGQVKKAKK